MLVPTREFIAKLNAARLAADVLGVPTIIIGRTDAVDAQLLTSDVDDRDKPFLTGTRTAEGFFGITGGIEAAIARAISYAPYCDLLWYESSAPIVEEAVSADCWEQSRMYDCVFTPVEPVSGQQQRWLRSA